MLEINTRELPFAYAANEVRFPYQRGLEGEEGEGKQPCREMERI